MARLPFFVLTAVFLLIAVTFAFELDNEYQKPLQRCRRQIQGRQLRQCEQLVTRRGGRYWREMLEEEAEGNEAEHLEGCCREIKGVEATCRCEALWEIVRKKKREQSGRLQYEREMLEKVRDLPSFCRLGTRRCDVRF